MTAGMDLQQILDVSPFQRWLGLKLVRADAQGLEISMAWREELVSNPHTRWLHGGILASLVDLTGLYAILASGNVATATADLRVDYHRAATGGTLTARGRVLKLGRAISCAESFVTGADGKLLASGRGTYIMAPPA